VDRIVPICKWETCPLVAPSSTNDYMLRDSATARNDDTQSDSTRSRENLFGVNSTKRSEIVRKGNSIIVDERMGRDSSIFGE
jgi:hypothetical protein